MRKYFENFFFTIPFLENGAMYGPGSSKKMEPGGPKRKLPFLTVHTTGKKKGRCRHSPISKYHCLPMVHSNIVAPFFLLFLKFLVVLVLPPEDELHFSNILFFLKT